MDLIQELELRLEQEVEKLLEQEDTVARLREALEVLRPTKDRPVRPEVVVAVQARPDPVPTPAPSPRIDTRSLPECPACGSGMEPGIGTLKSGKTYRALMCNDPGCRNEILS